MWWWCACVFALEVIQLMRSFTSKQLVKEQYACGGVKGVREGVRRCLWRSYYWFLTNTGIDHLREVLHIPKDTVPNTLQGWRVGCMVVCGVSAVGAEEDCTDDAGGRAGGTRRVRRRP